MEEKKYTFLKVLTIIFLIAMIAAFVFVSILYFSTILDMLKYDANDPNNDSTLGIGVGLVFTIIFGLIYLAVSIPSLIISIAGVKLQLMIGKVSLIITLSLYLLLAVFLVLLVIISNTYKVPVTIV